MAHTGVLELDIAVPREHNPPLNHSSLTFSLGGSESDDSPDPLYCEQINTGSVQLQPAVCGYPSSTG